MLFAVLLPAGARAESGERSGKELPLAGSDDWGPLDSWSTATDSGAQSTRGKNGAPESKTEKQDGTETTDDSAAENSPGAAPTPPRNLLPPALADGAPFFPSTTLRKRFSAAEAERDKLYRRLARPWYKALRSELGDPEFTACSVHWIPAGSSKQGASEEKKARKNPAQLERKQHASLIKSITETGCDVVALQGFSAPSVQIGNTKLGSFAKRLGAASSSEWQTYVGDAAGGEIRSAFLVKKGIKSLRRSSFAQYLLPSDDVQLPETFSSPPMLLSVSVPSSFGRPPKTVHMVTFELKVNIEPQDETVKLMRLKVVEAVRQISRRYYGDNRENPDHFFLLLGDFLSPPSAADERVAEGRLRFSDFLPGGSCTFSPASRAECNPWPRRPQILFFVRAPDERKFTQRALVFQQHLPNVRKGREGIKLYFASHVPVQNGLENASLLAVKLNW